ncbi:aldo/keto reductase [Dyadobacter aurulentus]|uniref:aldo/keto reductase n=1 Tax=Dyadobacter sp. UC 10 TaxID=2605428 RepID=UPI0011F20998|nr:aldo/keto reductase [Dyadobacter sp. UC 10]KAA0992927.1 aldo/keto reductase [Dyadobacter sp. UC 10]
MKALLLRREMLQGMGAAGAAMLLDTFPAHPTNAAPMLLQRTIPATGEKIPAVGLGSWQQFDVGTSKEERNPLREVLSKMKEMGGKVVDASPMYGRAEQVIGDLTSELQINDQFFFATKVWTSGRQAGVDQMNESLKKMKRTRLDLMQIHNLLDWETHLKTLRDWKAEGKIRYIGITHYTDSAHARLEQIVKSKAVDIVQFNYSIKSRNAETSLLNAAKDHDVAVLINEPFEQGALFRAVKGKQLPGWAAEYDIKSWAQFFLKYIVSHAAVTSVIPGTSDVKHLVDNLGAGLGRLPDSNARKMMVKTMEAL